MCAVPCGELMKRAFIVSALLFCAAVPAAAQTEGRVSVGASISWVNPTDSEVQPLVGWGPLIRLNPRKGWGIAGGFSWFRAEIDNPTGAGGDFINLRVRPLMAGVAYTAGKQPLLVSFSIVAGPSFNKLEFDDSFLRSLPPGSAQPELDANTSFAVRPGVGLTWTLAPRIAAVGFGGYVINRPDVFYRSPAGQEFRNRWKADAVLLSIGLVYSLF
jgi:Outer membrane protein beta-barrel domain